MSHARRTWPLCPGGLPADAALRDGRANLRAVALAWSVGQVRSGKVASVIALQVMGLYVVTVDMPLSALAVSRRGSAGLVAHLESALAQQAGGDLEHALSRMARRARLAVHHPGHSRDQRLIHRS